MPQPNDTKNGILLFKKLYRNDNKRNYDLSLGVFDFLFLPAAMTPLITYISFVMTFLGVIMYLFHPGHPLTKPHTRRPIYPVVRFPPLHGFSPFWLSYRLFVPFCSITYGRSSGLGMISTFSWVSIYHKGTMMNSVMYTT